MTMVTVMDCFAAPGDCLRGELGDRAQVDVTAEVLQHAHAPRRINRDDDSRQAAASRQDHHAFGGPPPDTLTRDSAFTQRTGVGCDAGIYSLPVSGGTPTLLTAGQKAFTNRPTWSGDGKLITYSVQSPDSGTVDVYVMAPDGSNKRRITNRPVSERSPQFSADDKEIIFVRGLLAMDAVNVETGAIRTLFDGDLRIGDWSFSQDRKSLVIGGRRDVSVLYKADVRALMREER